MMQKQCNGFRKLRVRLANPPPHRHQRHLKTPHKHHKEVLMCYRGMLHSRWCLSSPAWHPQVLPDPLWIRFVSIVATGFINLKIFAKIAGKIRINNFSYEFQQTWRSDYCLWLSTVFFPSDPPCIPEKGNIFLGLKKFNELSLKKREFSTTW